MNNINTEETWQVEVNGQIYETDFAEMTLWIDDGSLQPQDKVRKGTRWIEARKVPSLMSVFNAKEKGLPMPVVVTTTVAAKTEAETVTENIGSADANAANPQVPNAEFCCMHPEAPTAFVCQTCANAFCKTCPNSYGGSVKICPFCGAMCKSVAQVEQARATTHQYQTTVADGKFGFGDFGDAIGYPFKFKSSLFFGAIMFMFFSLGQTAASIGGIFLIASALICFMLANMLTFGVLANTIENFTQGKLNANFMPEFDDFSLWDDVVHPFFLSIGVYISSFGPLILIVVIGVYMMIGAVRSEIETAQTNITSIAAPPLPYDQTKTAEQSKTVRELIDNFEKENETAVAVKEGELPPEELTFGQQNAADEEAEIQKLNNMIQDSRKAQLESVIGKSPETQAEETQAMLSRFLGMAVPFLLLVAAAFLWGIFYFPAACAVAGYTRSFMATVNPLVGLDTIRHLGFTYAKILFFGFLLLVASSVIGAILNLIFIPFDMPGVGNLPAKAIGSLFTFYFAVVFACLLGYALYKNSDRLQLFR